MLKLIKYNIREFMEWFMIVLSLLLVYTAITVRPFLPFQFDDKGNDRYLFDANDYFNVGSVFRYLFLIIVFIICINGIRAGVIADKIEKGYERVKILISLEISLALMMIIMLTMEMIFVHYFHFVVPHEKFSVSYSSIIIVYIFNVLVILRNVSICTLGIINVRDNIYRKLLIVVMLIESRWLLRPYYVNPKWNFIILVAMNIGLIIIANAISIIEIKKLDY